MSGKQLLASGDRLASHLEAIVSSHPELSLLDGLPNIRVVVGPHNADRVALISGGGSGHEPAFAGFVGEGLLSAAVCGDIYAAPSADAVLSAIRTVTGKAGCLLLPLNYTGDRLNFGLAALRTSSEGFRVETVPIDDDCAIKDTGRVGRRGLAGSVLAIKILGAAAKRGTDLEELVQLAKSVIHRLGTVGVGLDTCALPGQPPIASRLAPDETELGLGIHGEPGAEKIKERRLDVLVEMMLERILNFDSRSFSEGVALGVLINNLGGMTIMDLNGVLYRAARLLQDKGRSVAFGWVGTLVTSVTVTGFSITLLAMQAKYEELLADPVDVPSWPFKHPVPFTSKPRRALPIGDDQSSRPVTGVSTLERGVYGRCIEAVIDRLIENEGLLNDYDSKVGDGDCGTTLANAARSMRTDVDAYPFDRPAALLEAIGKSIGRSSGGTSGALYSIFLSGAAAGLTQTTEETTALHVWISALDKGIEAIGEYGRARRGDRTMVDALEPALGALRRASQKEQSIDVTLKEMCEAATDGVRSTIGMPARLGRASYVPEENLKTTPDPGAKAVEIWLKAIVDGILMSP